MLRKAITKNLESNSKGFRFRGHELKRIEAFSDAVFALAVTLLIVSLEVPDSFEELMVTMRGFFAFGVSFILLMIIWYEQNVFFRRYGLDDVMTTTLNCTLIFLVLFFVYPLKFLFTLIFSTMMYGEGNSPLHLSRQDSPTLMFIYGSGYIFIYLLFLFMYTHALRKKEELQLTITEQFDTRTKMFSHLILISVGILSIAMSQLLSPDAAGSAGMIYFLIGPAFTIFYNYRSRKRKKLSKEII